MNTRIFILLMAMLMLSQASRLTNTANKKRFIWKTDNPKRQDCWASCTAQNGFACGYGDQGRWTSEKYQCTKTQEICEKWLNYFENCRSTGCKGKNWEFYNIKKHNVFKVSC